MSSRTARGKLTAPVVLLAAAGLTLAGAVTGVPFANAAEGAPALHQTARISLGTTTNAAKNAFTEAPGGTVFYSRGSVVYVVNGNSHPAIAVHAGGTVMALAANSSDLFVLTGLTVTEYARSNGAKVRHWNLSSPVRHITMAGIIAVGKTLWAWTDWITDSTGFEYADVSRISTTSSVVHVVDKRAFPSNVAANSSGLYYQDAKGAANTQTLVHVTPTGSVHSKAATDANGPEALSGGSLDMLSFHGRHLNLDGYSTSTLARISSARVSGHDEIIAGTSIGLLVLAGGSSATVSKLSTTGTTSGTVGVPDAFTLLAGPSAAVIEDVGGHMFLVRLGS